MLRPANPATESESPFSKSVAGLANFAGRGPRRPKRSMATAAAMTNTTNPTRSCTRGTVTKDVPSRTRRNTKMTIRPTVVPMAKPPHKNANSCRAGLGLFSMSTVMPILNGSMLTARAIIRTVASMSLIVVVRPSKGLGVQAGELVVAVLLDAGRAADLAARGDGN